MKIVFKTQTDLHKHIDKLRLAGVTSVSYRNCRADILSAIIEDANRNDVDFEWAELPRFEGDFKEYHRILVVHFNELHLERMKEKRDAKKKS